MRCHMARILKPLLVVSEFDVTTACARYVAHLLSTNAIRRMATAGTIRHMASYAIRHMASHTIRRMASYTIRHTGGSAGQRGDRARQGAARPPHLRQERIPATEIKSIRTRD